MKRFLLLFLLVITIQYACAFCTSTPIASVPSILPDTAQQTLYPANKGEYYGFQVQTGIRYNFTTCGSGFDTQIYGKNSITSGLHFDYDNVGPACSPSGNYEDFDYTSGFTGTLHVAVHRSDCNWNSTSAAINYRQVTTVINTTSTEDLCLGDSRILTDSILNGAGTTLFVVYSSSTGVYDTLPSTSNVYTPTAIGFHRVYAYLGAAVSSLRFYVNDSIYTITPAVGDTICRGTEYRPGFESNLTWYDHQWQYLDSSGVWKDAQDNEPPGFTYWRPYSDYMRLYTYDTTATGTYTFRCIGGHSLLYSSTDSLTGCYKIFDPIEITIMEQPQIFMSAPDSMCVGGDLELRIDSITSFFGDTLYSGFRRGYYHVIDSFVDSVQLTMLSSSYYSRYLAEAIMGHPSCSVTVVKDVHPAASPIASILAQDYCLGGNGILELVSHDYTLGTIDSMQWLLDTIPFLGENDSVFNVPSGYDTTTTFGLYLEDTDNGCAYTTLAEVEVDSQATARLLNDTMVCLGDSITLNANGTSGGVGWNAGSFWQSTNDTVSPDWETLVTTPFKTWTFDSIMNEQYYRYVAVYDGNGCDTAYSNPIKVYLDTVPPTAICKNITLVLDAPGYKVISFADIDDGSYDNCGIDSVYFSIDSFTCAELGPNLIAVHVVDELGNVSVCNPMVTVQENQIDPPVGINASAPSICLGSVTDLMVAPFHNPNTRYIWWEGSCGGNYIGEGAIIMVAPVVTSDYYVQAISACGTSSTVCAGPFTVLVNGSSSVSPSDILPTAFGTYSSSCTVTDSLWHFFYTPSGYLLAGVRSTNIQDLGNVTISVEVGNYGPFGMGFPAGACGNAGVSDGEYAMPRNWDISITGMNPPLYPVEVRYFFDSTEVGNLSDTIAALSYAADYISCWGNVSTEADLMMTVLHSDGTTELFNPIAPSLGPNLAIRQLDFELDKFSRGYLHSKGGISGADNALPVQLVYFDVQNVQNEYAHITWQTATEINNAGFELLRSTDGIHFEKIAWIAGNGNSNEVRNYSYTDQYALAGFNYYRLNQIDFNGDNELLPIRTLEMTPKAEVERGKVYPNPTKDAVSWKVVSTTSTLIDVVVINYMGQMVQQKSISIQEGTNEVKMNVAELPDGAYSILYDFNDTFYNFHFVVLK